MAALCDGGPQSRQVRVLYSTFIVDSHLRRSGMEHAVLPANYTIYLPLPRKLSRAPDDAATD